ncbi:Lariat debranching enzyme B [Halotydeus destructor]|nr:Lariat debranching enzyme B [Halotydeus destructor]
MKIAVVGCVHGELDKVYQDIQQKEKAENTTVDLVLICGDFQTIRNKNDLKCMAVPQKYLSLGTFHEYYSGKRKAPYLTLFIGGNHEASNYLSSLPYGGWVADNIYYLGYASVVQFGGLRIGGISGIFKKFDAEQGHFERLPFDRGSIRSVYHTRTLEAYRMMQIANDKNSQPIDIMLSHDWPLNIHTCGNVGYLLKVKPFFRSDVQNNALGNPLFEPLIPHLKPRHWFSAHLHVRFQATVHHDETTTTNFLALDKCLPRRPYFEFIDVSPTDKQIDESRTLQYDPEWLVILKKTNKYMSIEKFPKVKVPQIWIIAEETTEQDLETVRSQFNNDLLVPSNFSMSEPVSSIELDSDPERVRNFSNPQTVAFCEKLQILEPMTEMNKGLLQHTNPDEIDLDDGDWEEGITENDQVDIKKLKSNETGEDDDLATGFVIDTQGRK